MLLNLWKMGRKFTLFLLAGVLMVNIISLVPDLSAQGRTRFSCGAFNGVPATMYNTPTKSSPLILWKSRKFGVKYPPEKRCQQVSNILQTGYSRGQKNLTWGRKNKQNILCLTSVSNGVCEQQLLTLSKSEFPQTVLNNLIDRMKGNSSTVLEQFRPVFSEYEYEEKHTEDGFQPGEKRTYINLEQMLSIIDTETN